MEPVGKKGYFILFCTGLLIGGLTGIILLNSFISYRIDEYHKRIETLESEIEEKNIQLKKLEEAINKRRLIVKSIEVNIENEEDELSRIALQKHIKEKLGKFIGKEVSKVDIDLLWEVVDQRIMKIGDKEYKLEVDKLIISENIYVWVKVKLLT